MCIINISLCIVNVQMTASPKARSSVTAAQPDQQHLQQQQLLLQQSAAHRRLVELLLQLVVVDIVLPENAD